MVALTGVMKTIFVAVNAQSFGIKNQARLNFAIQAFNRRCRQHAFGRATDSHQRMDVGARNCRADSR